jgi:hypothetical protein
MAKTESWYVRHASALFITVLVLIGIGLGLYGLRLSQRGPGGISYFGNVLAHFSGALLAAAIGTVFLSLPDVRQYVASTVARLFSHADVVELLSSDTKDRLRERLAIDAVKASASMINGSLFNHLQVTLTTSLANPYVTNLSFSTVISPHLSNSHLVATHRIVSYRINARNLSSPQYKFPFVFFTDASFPSEFSLVVEDWFQYFSARVGDVQFGKADLQLQEKKQGNLTVFEAELSRDVFIAEEVDVTIEYRIFAPLSDPIMACFARYPSYGVSATLHFSEDYAYDCAWFMACPPSSNIPGRGQVNYPPNGISVRTNDWMLPGEGVVLYYCPKPGILPGGVLGVGGSG